jgi:hypothetical protein
LLDADRRRVGERKPARITRDEVRESLPPHRRSVDANDAALELDAIAR